MTKALPLAGALLLLSFAAFAAPCAVGTTTSAKGPTTQDTSSNTEGGSTAKTTPGAKGESPGTVGAMNNLGDKTKPQAGEKPPAEGQTVKPGDDKC